MPFLPQEELDNLQRRGIIANSRPKYSKSGAAAFASFYEKRRKEEEEERRRPKSLSDKAAHLIQSVGGEIGRVSQGVATGVVRALPGGTADLDAAQKAAQQQEETTRMLLDRIKQKGMSQQQKARLQQVLKSTLQDPSNNRAAEISKQVQRDADKSAFIGNTLELGSLLIPGGNFVKGARGAKALLRPTLTSTASGYLGGAGYEMGSNPDESVADALTSGSALIGGAAGALFPVAGKGVAKATGRGVQYAGKAGEEVARKLGVDEKLGYLFTNRLASFRKSDIQTAKAMAQRGEVKNWREGLKVLRSEGRDLEQISNEVMDSAGKTQQYLQGAHNGQKIKFKDSMRGLMTKSTAKGTVEADNQFALDMFDLEVRSKRGITTQAEPTEVVERRVADYKKANPDWEHDLKVRKNYLDGLLDVDVESGALTKETADYIKGYYKNPAPINRLFDEEGLVRPEIRGGVKNVSKDNIARYLEGGIQDADLTYAPYIDRAKNAFSQNARTRLRREIDDRVTRGELRGEQHVKAEVTAQRLQLKDTYDAISKDLDLITKLTRREAAKARVAKAKATGVARTQKAITKGEERTNRAKVSAVAGKEKLKINAANRRLAQNTKKIINGVVKTKRLSGVADESTAVSMQFVDKVVNKMTPTELVQLSHGISGAKSIDAIRETISKAAARTAKAQKAGVAKTTTVANKAEAKALEAQAGADELVGLVGELRAQRDTLKLSKREYGDKIAELQQNVPTNINTIKYIKDGNLAVTEVDKGIMKSLENLEGENGLQGLIKKANYPSSVFKATWTSNPFFALPFYGAKAIFTPILTFNTSRAGVRDLVNPLTIIEAMKPSFGRQLKSRGAIAEGAIETARKPQISADMVVATRGLKNPIASTKALKNLATSKEGLKASLDKLNTIGAFIDNASRRWSAAGVKRRALREGVKRNLSKGESMEAALRQAADDYNDVLGSFQRTTDLVRAMEAVLPYTQAGQAGVTAFGRAIRERPKETIPRLVVTATAIGAGVQHFMDDPNATEFIKEQYDAGRASQVDGWIFIPNPFEGGLKKVDDGKGKHHWEGAWKIRLPADFRPLAGMFYRGAMDAKTGSNSLDEQFVVGAIAQLGLGGVFADTNKTTFNPIAAFQQGPVGILSNVISGVDPNTGKKVDGWGARGALLARDLGSTVNWLTDYGNALVDEEGNFNPDGDNIGDFVTASIQRWGKGVKAIPKRLFTETAGVSDGSKIHREVQNALKGQSDKTVALYQAMHIYDKDDNSAGMFYNSSRAQMLIDNPDLFELEKKVAEIRNKYNGKPIDPIFNVKDTAERNAILSTQIVPTALRGSSNLNSEIYESNYYQKYQQERDAYYKHKKEWNKAMGYDSPADSEYPTPSTTVKKKQDVYYSLTPRQKKYYKQANPDLNTFFIQKEDWENRQRQQYTNATGVSLKLDDYYK